MAERDVEVDHVTVYRWVQRFTPMLIDAARPLRHAVGGHWLVDETYVKVAGRWRYVGSVALVVPGPFVGHSGSVKRCRRRDQPTEGSSGFAGFRFPPEVIVVAVRWYLRFGLSYRDVEELLAERGVEVDHVTIYRSVRRFTPMLIDAARPCRHAVGGRWFVDETYVKVAGSWRYVHRAIDEHGQVIDVLVSDRRDIAAGRRFFRTLLGEHTEPVEWSPTGPQL